MKFRLKKYIKIKKKKIKTNYVLILAGLIILSIFLITLADQKDDSSNDNKVLEKNIREPIVAGQFYPDDPAELKTLLESFYENAKEPGKFPAKALILPHAGYIYSGQVAAHGFNTIDENIKRVIIIGSNHNSEAQFNGISIPPYTHYQTPLGEVKVADDIFQLEDSGIFTTNIDAHKTHIIEVELPFLQEKIKHFEIMPFIIGNVNKQHIEQFADILIPFLDEKTLIIVSSDLSHYHPYDEAVLKDTRCINSIRSGDYNEAVKCEACGYQAFLALFLISHRKGWSAEILDYKNSGDTAGKNDSVVGYSSIKFYLDDELNDNDKKNLLLISRSTLQNYVSQGLVPIVSEDSELIDPKLRIQKATFVTLKKEGQLRGCIGQIMPIQTLFKDVIENTISAAIKDSRFEPVTSDEIEDIEISISVLTTPKAVASDAEKRAEFVVKDIDGIILEKGIKRSVYLPSVWEQIPDKSLFLEQLCYKGNMDKDCWNDPSVNMYKFQTVEFSESEYGLI